MSVSVAFVASHMTPRLGLEKAVESLAAALADYEFPRPDVHTVRLGGALRGWARVGTLGRIRGWLRNADCDVVVGCGIWAAVPLLLSATGHHAPPIVVWEHSLSDRKVYSDRRRLGVLRMTARLLYRRAARVVCVSETQRSHLAAILPSERLAVISNIVAAPMSSGPGPEPTCGRLLSVGTLTATKNHHLAIRALALLPGTFLTIAGEGPLRPELNRLADELGVSDRIELVGYRDDLHALYAASQVVVHPSLGETFGYVLFEAADHDRPVVVLDAPWARELVPARVPGRVSLRPTPASFADAVRAAMTSRITPAERDQAWRSRRALTSPAEVAGRWLTLFGELTDPPTVPDP